MVTLMMISMMIMMSDYKIHPGLPGRNMIYGIGYAHIHTHTHTHNHT